MSRTPRYEDVIAEMTRLHVLEAESALRFELQAIESPIEKVLVATMLAHGWRSSFDAGYDMSRDAFQAARDLGLLLPPEVGRFTCPVRLFVEGWPGLSSACLSQASLRLANRTIRPDFAFIWLLDEHRVNVIVELDGHDFHERTPEQAQSDKSRDRELQALGWNVLRFTGREVLRSPADCLHEVQSLLESKSRAAYDAFLQGQT